MPTFITEREAIDRPYERDGSAGRSAPLKSLFWAALLLPLVVVALLALLEVFFAMAHIGEETVIRPDPIYGYAHLSGQNVTYRLEGYSHFKMNSTGFRDREFAVKPQGVKRIVVLGDSMTLGLEVEPGLTFSKVLEANLNKGDGAGKYEVLNCGMTGFGTGQSYLLLLKDVLPLKPDLVILAHHYGDIDDNVSSGTNPPRPAFSVDKNQQLHVDWRELDGFLKGGDARFYYWLEELRRNSRVLAVLTKLELDTNQGEFNLGKNMLRPLAALRSQLCSALPAAKWEAQEVRARLTSQIASLPPAQLDVPMAPLKVQTVNNQTTTATAATTATATLNSAPKTSAPQVFDAKAVLEGRCQSDLFHGWLAAYKKKRDVTLAIVQAMDMSCRQNGAKFVIATLPSTNNMLFYFRELDDIERSSAQHNIDCWRMDREFPSIGPMEKNNYYYGSHFTPAGHKLIASILEKQFASRR